MALTNQDIAVMTLDEMRAYCYTPWNKALQKHIKCFNNLRDRQAGANEVKVLKSDNHRIEIGWGRIVGLIGFVIFVGVVVKWISK